MQKKMVGILASVAAAHAVLAIALMTGGGCRQHKILAPHTYNDGPEVAEIPAAANNIPASGNAVENMPKVPGGDAPVALPQDTTPVPVKYNDPVPVTQTAPVSGGSKTYKVKKGDTLSMIAFKHGIRTNELAACNNLSGKAMNNIRIGQVLTIPDGAVYNENRKPKRSARKSAAKSRKASKKPAKAVKTAALPADGIYVVKSGDSLDRIGRRYGVSAKAIAKENNIALTKILQIGDKLRIPGKAAAAVKNDNAAKSVTDTSVSEVSNSDLLNDLNPSEGLTDSTSAAPASETSAAASQTAAPADSAANTAAAETAPPVAAPATASATAPAAPATAPAAPATRTESLEVLSDMTLEEFCKRNVISVEDVRRLNPDLPADGKLKGGTYLSVPRID